VPEVQSQTIIDPLTGSPVVIVGGRQTRPNNPTGMCPFCPGGLEAPEPYDVFSFVNRWPPLPGGRAEVVLYTSDHTGLFWTMGRSHIKKVIELWEQRTVDLGNRPDVAYVLVFENRGAEVGATIAHPHGQIYGFDFVPPKARYELETDSCALCTADPGDRLVSISESWRAWVPEAASWPYELLIAPTEHFGDLPAAAKRRSDLADILADTLARLDQLFDGPMPYMMWIHQRPPDGGDWPNAHVHFHISPLLRAPNTQRYVAAAEQGSGVYFNPVAPMDAAAAMRLLDGMPKETP